MPILTVGIDCIDDFAPPHGAGTADVLINPANRMLRFPPGAPPASGTVVCFTYEALQVKAVLAQDGAKAALEGQKGAILDVTGLTTDQAQDLLDGIICNPDDGSVASQYVARPIEETPPTIIAPPTIPKIGTPVKVPVPKVPQIPNFPFPRDKGPAGGGGGPTERTDTKDDKGKHSTELRFGPQDNHQIEDYVGSHERKLKGIPRAAGGRTGALPTVQGGLFGPVAQLVPRVFGP